MILLVSDSFNPRFFAASVIFEYFFNHSFIIFSILIGRETEDFVFFTTTGVVATIMTKSKKVNIQTY